MKARIAYYAEKARLARASGTLAERARRRVRTSLIVWVTALWGYLRLGPRDRGFDVAAGFADHRRPGRGAADREIAERILAAYAEAKAVETRAHPDFRVRGLWREWIDANYGPLIEALRGRDRAWLLSLLENFAREQFALGTGAGYDDYLRKQVPVLGRAYVLSVWCDYRDRLRGAGYPLSLLEHPLVGNPPGLPMNGSIVGAETLRHAYHAWEMMGFFEDCPRPLVVEIGGGFGGQAYQLHTLAAGLGEPLGRYVDFDIPEVQAVASYFLLKALPGMDIRLCGEGAVDGKYAVGLFPPPLIEDLPEKSIDLVFNSHSFSEMDGVTALRYLREVERISRRHFFHVNHEVPLTFRQPDGSVSRNRIGSAMTPDPGLFELVFRRPREFARPEDRGFESYEYLFSRVRGG